MNDEKPIFIQIIEMIEDDILSGVYSADGLIISTPQISKLLGVNPATAQKAIGILTDGGIVYKKRGVGMAVSARAKGLILEKRKADFFERAVKEFVAAAKKIGIGTDELIGIIARSN
ncbi:MAG: GntR family transcriptional regulator [Clostridiales bacterium]|jgi:DNA-binding transcriptional regulator YhcF (GntR family)|nr:GntR family transcriptional regulator [Clostridiales bacterium]